jgi:ATP-binding cassette subfamily B protein
MIAEYFGKSYSLQFLREKSFIDRAGVSLKGISEAAEAIGYRTLAVKVALTNKDASNVTGGQVQPCLKEAPLPCIVHWNQNHFVVAYKITKNHVYIADPGDDKIKLTYEEFKKSYCSDGNEGVALLLETTPEFYNEDADTERRKGFGFIFEYLSPHRRLLIQVIIGLLLGTVFQLIFPFLTQCLVDIGIDTHNLQFIYIILAAQLMLTFSQTIVRFIQSWILLHVSTRINVNMVADFLIKIMKLPLSFFDAKNVGDIMQRIGDHRRIESFLTQSVLASLLSVINLVVFSIILAIYHQLIFLIFATAAVMYIAWIVIFLKKRKEVDYRSFQQMSDNQDALYEIIQGMQEIKLQGSYFKRRWTWTFIQAKLFKVQMTSLAIGQYQDAGAQLINQIKDILITVIAANAVMDGELTLGMMLAIQYIIGQLNSPLQQLVTFIRAAQDAAISLERISEVHIIKNEENEDSQKISFVPAGDIHWEN